MQPPPNPYAPPQLYPQAAPPGAGTPEGESAVRIQLVLQIVLGSIHALFVLSAVINLALVLGGIDLGAGARAHASDAEEAGRRAGQIIGFLLSFTWSIGGTAWCGINTYGILKKQPWTFRSLHAYWIALIATCCCFPAGIFGLLHVRKPHVRAALGFGA
jgi:hypothetical protein